MTIPNVTENNTFEHWLITTNLIANNIGDLALLNTVDKTNIVNAINEIITGSVTVENLTIPGIATFNGNMFLGNALSDSITIGAGSLDIGNYLNIDTGLMYLDGSNRKVGFGTTTTPIAGLEVSGIHSTSGTVGRYRLAVNDTAPNAIGVGGGTSFFSNGQELVNIRAYKEGTGSLASSCYISTSNGSAITLRLGITSTGSIISGANNTQSLGTNTNRWASFYTNSATIGTTLTLETGNITAGAGINISSLFKIDTVNSRLGIGTTTPTCPLTLTVNGVAQTNWVETAKLTNAKASKGIQFGYSSSTNRSVIASSSGGVSSGFEFWYYNSTTSLFEKGMQLDSNGIAQFPKGGIQLSNTPNTGTSVLDWYEEGNFFPTLEINGSQSSSFISREGSYTRIGNRVYFNATIKLSSVTGTGIVKIGALPFTSANNANRDFAVSIHAYNMASGVSSLMAKILENMNKIEIGFPSPSGTLTALTNSHLASNTVISVSGHYEV